MLPAADGNVLLEDAVDPMIPTLGSFELIDDDPRTFSWGDESRSGRVKRLVKLPALVCGGLLLVCGVALSFNRGAARGPRPGEEEHGTEASSHAQHPSLMDARNESSTGIVHGTTIASSTSTSATSTGSPETLENSAGGAADPSRSSAQASATTIPPTTSSIAGSSSSSSSSGSSEAKEGKAASTTTQTTSSTTCASSPWNRYRECQSDSGEIRALRCQSWPCERKGVAPEISRAVYINLDRDFRRRNWMEGQLQALSKNVTAEAQLRGKQRNFTTERVSAVDIRQAQSDPEYEHIRQHGFNPTPYPDVRGKWSVAGCSLSHLKILRRLQKHADELLSRHQVWLILEDDAIVKPEIDSDWRRIWPWLPDEWDIVRLGWFGGSTCIGRVNDRIDLAIWSDPPPSGPCSYCGSHAYIVNPASVDKVIHRVEGSKMMHVDCLLSAPTPPMEDPRSLPDLRVYAARPMLVLQNEDFPSDNIS